nr:thioesterase family protein [Herbaspirillum rubrisubalbicans]
MDVSVFSQKSSKERPMQAKPFSLELEVRYRDIDTMGHVSSPVYYEYVQHAYVSYMHWLLEVPLEAKLPQIMVKTTCEYLEPAKLGDRLSIQARVTRFGSKSFEMEYAVSRLGADPVSVAKATSTHVAFDYASNASVQVPESLKRRVLQFQGAL